MILKNHLHISVSPEKLWPLVSNPMRALSWNPKLRHVIPVTLGEPTAGTQYRIRYHLVHGEGNYSAELMEYDEPVRCVLHLKGGNLPMKGYMQEIYEISAEENGCMLSQTILIEEAGIRLPGILKIRISNLFGAGSARRYLQKLKGLAESPQEAPAGPSGTQSP
jgi:hypothetical protein